MAYQAVRRMLSGSEWAHFIFVSRLNCLSFALMVSLCTLAELVSEKSIPKYLIFFTKGMPRHAGNGTLLVLPSNLMCRMDDLDLLSGTQFYLHQFSTSLMLLMRLLVPLTLQTKSSANAATANSFSASCLTRSSAYIFHRRGEVTAPCGTPFFILMVWSLSVPVAWL